MASKPLRIGVVGVGFGTLVHIPAFLSEGLKVVAVCARRPERAKEAAEKFRIPQVCADLDEMLAVEGLDAVSLVTPPASHPQMVRAAAKAGKHILCEKPVAVNAAEALQMLQDVEGAGVTAMVAHEFRFASGRARVKELIAEGYVGEPILVRASMALDAFGGRGPTEMRAYSPDNDDAALGAGMLFHLGSHYIDGLIDWLGPVASVNAILTNTAPERRDGERIVKTDADNLYLLHLTFRSGAIAEIMGGMALPFGTGASVEVYGREGALVTPQGAAWNPPAHGEVLGAKVGEKELKPLPVPERLQPFTDDRDQRLMPFRLLVREFLRGIEEGTSPSPNFRDAWHVQQVLDGARTSAATGARVEIAQ